MNLPRSGIRRILILLVVIFLLLTSHSFAFGVHSASSECEVKAACWACCITLHSDSPELNDFPRVIDVYSRPVIAPRLMDLEPPYHPPK